MRLKDKIALVTGGGTGIGRATAIRFAQEGAKVVICSASEDSVKKAEKELAEIGGEVLAIQADVSNGEDVANVVAKTLDNYGTIDILINNAGLTRDNIFLRMSEDEWDQVIKVNLKGAFLFTKACTKVMLKKKQGRIINITSVIGVIGNAGQANYAASKAGVIGLTKSIAKELASRTITVNAIAPGFITTDMTDQLSEEQKQAALSEIPLGRFGDPKDIADLAVFLASENASYITGQVLHVDGGMVI